MKSFFTLLFLAVGLMSVSAQTVSDFENIAVDSFVNDAGSAGYFESGNIQLPNEYVTGDWSYWKGWAISSMTDTLTAGLPNQYSAITGSGVDGSDTYALGFGSNVIKTTGDAAGGAFEGLYLTNNAYAYHSMKDGDQFAKKFGGADGTEPDFFSVSFVAHKDGVVSTDTVTVFLADYRSDNPAEDYILKEWMYVDLKPLGDADSISISFASTDVGSFGINTPQYICVDNITTCDCLVPTTDLAPSVSLYPNPTTDRIYVADAAGKTFVITDLMGRAVTRGTYTESIDVSQFPSGTYVLLVNNDTTTFIKQ